MASSKYLEEGASLCFDDPPLPAGWVWNGYYTRVLNSPTLNFFGKVAIRVAFNKEEGVHHAYLPAFIIPYLKITIYDLKFILLSFLKFFSVNKTLEKYSQLQEKEFFDLPLSSLYSLLEWFIRECRVCQVYPSESNAISVFKKAPRNIITKYLQYFRSRASP